MTFDQAQEYCGSLRSAEVWNWRLPTWWELKALSTVASVPNGNSRTVKLHIHSAFLDGFKDVKKATVWSCSPAGSPSDDAASCYNFSSDSEDVSNKANMHYVLAVSDSVH
jgi:hypothetical protein